jgi:hypothetical protein
MGGDLTKLSKARQFADPERGYSARRLEALCRLLEQRRPNFGISHVGALVTVSWEDGRGDLQEACVKGNWSVRRLQRAILTRLGWRRQGGRHRRVDVEPEEAMVQLDQMAGTWQRWCEEAERKQGDGEDATLFSRLRKPVREAVTSVSEAVQRLRDALDPVLGEQRGPSWARPER